MCDSPAPEGEGLSETVLPDSDIHHADRIARQRRPCYPAAMLTLGDLFASPDHYLFAFDGDLALFREMDAAAYRRSIFLDRRIDPAGPGMLKVPIGPLLAHGTPRQTAPIGWIFHIAHCGSTLLARGLDGPEDGLVLREPLPLRQLAVEATAAFADRPADAGWQSGLRLVAAMLARSYEGVAPTVVKANVPVNFILPELMALDPEAKAILLHFSLDDYLAAILRSPEHRAWLASVMQEIAPAIEADVGPIDGLDDAERAAALWLTQMRIYARALDRWPQLRSLDAEHLFDAPQATIIAARAYFGRTGPADPATITALTSTYAKNPQAAFDNAARLERRAAIRRQIAPELTRGNDWVRKRLAACPLPDRLARPLIDEGARLIND